MNDWRYDYAINDTSEWFLIDLHVDVELMVTLENLLDEANDTQGAPEHARESERRGEH